jgi:hypothetical protein
MRIPPFVIIENVTRKQSLPAKMESVLPSYGTVTSIMIAEMTAMSPLTCVGTKTVPPDGRDVQGTPITDAFQNGYSATERMIAGMAVMSFHKTVTSVRRRETLHAGTRDVFRSDGFVTLKMIAVITPMRMTQCAQEDIESAQSPSLDAEMTNAYRPAGGAIMTMIAATGAMNQTVLTLNVPQKDLSAHLGTVSSHSSNATGIKIATTCPTSWDVRRDIQMANIAPTISSHVITSCA